MDKELNVLIGAVLKSKIGDRDDVLRTSKLVNGTKMTISLNELDNSDNLKDGKPSNILFTFFPRHSHKNQPIDSKLSDF